MAEELPAYLTSPGAAFSRQAELESALNAAVQAETEAFLEDVAELALATALLFSAAAVAAAWASHVNAMVDAVPFESDAERAAAREQLLADSTPDAAYDAATAVLAIGAAAAFGAAALGSAMRATLRPSAGMIVRLTADGLVPASGAAVATEGISWAENALRVARTTATGMFGAAAEAALKLVDRFVGKRWVSRHDDRVRPSHLAANGQTVPLTSPFRVGAASLMYPGEPVGVPSETINCRCVMIGVLRIGKTETVLPSVPAEEE